MTVGRTLNCSNWRGQQPCWVWLTLEISCPVRVLLGITNDVFAKTLSAHVEGAGQDKRHRLKQGDDHNSVLILYLVSFFHPETWMTISCLTITTMKKDEMVIVIWKLELKLSSSEYQVLQLRLKQFEFTEKIELPEDNAVHCHDCPGPGKWVCLR